MDVDVGVLVWVWTCGSASVCVCFFEPSASVVNEQVNNFF